MNKAPTSAGLPSYSVLSSISGQLLQLLQSVFNAARLVFSTMKSEHVTPLLRELHRLKVPGRIQFQLCILIYCCLNGTVPSYLAETRHLTADIGLRRHLRSAPHNASCWVIEPFQWLLLERRMLFRYLFVLRHRCCSSTTTLRRQCSSQPNQPY